LKAKDKKVYEAVKQRAVRTDLDGYEYLACEKCGSNGQKYPLQMCHIIPRSQGGLVTTENIYLGCSKCHFKNDHGENIVDSKPMF